jgi:hypothetical protein
LRGNKCEWALDNESFNKIGSGGGRRDAFFNDPETIIIITITLIITTTITIMTMTMMIIKTMIINDCNKLPTPAKYIIFKIKNYDFLVFVLFLILACPFSPTTEDLHPLFKLLKLKFSYNFVVNSDF